MDKLTPEQRHKNMAAIHSQNTKPEMLVRRYLWHQGFRYRVSDKRLPGKPDLVLTTYRTVIFINGCFWHGHQGCKYFRLPHTNVEFWTHKIDKNQARDERVRKELEEMGWNTMVVWECQLRDDTEATLAGIAHLLRKSYLNILGVKNYDLLEEEPLPLAAEDDKEYGK